MQFPADSSACIPRPSDPDHEKFPSQQKTGRLVTKGGKEEVDARNVASDVLQNASSLHLMKTQEILFSTPCILLTYKL